MATSTLLQTLDADANQMGVTASNRRQVETFIANATIAAGDLLSLDLAQAANADKALYVKVADTGSDDTRCAVGVALHAATAGDPISAVIAGLVEAKVKAGTARGTRMAIYSTAGILEPYQASFEDPIFAVTGAAESGGKAIVFVLKQF